MNWATRRFLSHNLKLVPHPDFVVGGFFGDENVVRVAFLEAGRRDLHKFGRSLEFFDAARADVAHATTQPTY